MICELVVTSAPRGLQAGRSGFTTVLRTRGIHPDLAARLEAASAYRHVHPQGDPRNPVVFCYAPRTSAVGEWWVMSRIGDAGTDYTGRSNKIAHHIALQSGDLAAVAASNPAAVMAALVASGGLLTRWEGEPRENPVPPDLSPPQSVPVKCQRWAAAAGDAGWAGVLVERALNREATWVIAPPGVDLLALYAEALSLVSPAQRWQIPFTTYSLRGDEGRWLGTTAGSPEAAAALGQNRVMVIDLTRRVPTTATGPYIQAARGASSVPWRQQPSPAAGRPAAPVPGAGGVLGGTLSQAGGLAPVAAGLPPMLRQPNGQSSPGDDEWEEIPIKPTRTGRMVLLAVMTLVTLVVFTSAVVYVAYEASPGFKKLVDSFLRDEEPTDETETAASTGQDQRTREVETTTATVSQPPSSIKATTVSGTLPPAVALSPASPAKPPAPKVTPPPKPSAKAIVNEAQNSECRGTIPPFISGAPAPVTLATWKTSAGTEVLSQLRLELPRLDDMPAEFALKLKKVEDVSPSSCVTWQCGTEGKADGVGTFTLSGTALSFQYASDPSPGHALLPLMPLQIGVSGEAKLSFLIQPDKVAVKQVDFRDDACLVELATRALPKELLDSLTKRLRLDGKIGLGMTADVPIEVALANDEPTYSETIKIPNDCEGQIDLRWRPKEVVSGSVVAADDKSDKSKRFDEPIKISFGMHEDTASNEGPFMISLATKLPVVDPMQKIWKNLPDTIHKQQLVTLLNTATNARLKPGKGYDEVVGWFARYIYEKKTSDDGPFAELRKALKDRKYAANRSLDGLIEAIKTYIQERDQYEEHVGKTVSERLARSYPAGMRPADPGPAPAPPKPGDKAAQARYDQRLKAWNEQDAKVRKYDAERSAAIEAVRADAADFRNWVEGIVAGSVDDRAIEQDSDDRQLAELWRMLHLNAVLRRGGLAPPSADSPPVFLHVNRLKGVAQLQWDFGSDGAVESVVATLADIDLKRLDAASPKPPVSGNEGKTPLTPTDL